MEHSAHSVNKRASRSRSRAIARAERADASFAALVLAALGLVFLSLIFAIGFAGKASAGQGEPAVEPLGILATPASLPLACADGVCRTTLSSISLDEHGRTAAEGSLYHLAEADIDSIMIGGQPMALIEGARLEATGHYSSLRLALPEAALRITGLPEGRARVMVTRAVAVSLADQPAAHIDIPSALAVLSVQETDTKVETMAGQLIARTLADLPAEGLSGAQAEARWQIVRAQAETGDVPSQALLMADGAFDRCHQAADKGVVRADQCLWSHHSNFLSVLNRAYWRAAVPGA